jgi:hypothetical protein
MLTGPADESGGQTYHSSSGTASIPGVSFFLARIILNSSMSSLVNLLPLLTQNILVTSLVASEIESGEMKVSAFIYTPRSTAA